MKLDKSKHNGVGTGIIFGLLILVFCQMPVSAGESVHFLLGNPSSATANVANKDNFLMVKQNYVLSYNDSKGIPNWVSWQLTKDDLGAAPRKRAFDTDNSLPDSFKHVNTLDYKTSGFDRGHMCPHSDRAKDTAMSYSTFIMTNIIPQAPNVNQKAWDQLEIYCRELVTKGNRLYICSGPLGSGGRGSKGYMTSLSDGKVEVPSACWKIAVVVPGDGQANEDIARITPETRVIAIIMPNDENSVGLEWGQYRTSVEEIEKQTHLKFFDKLPAEIAKALKEQVDEEKLPAPVAVQHGN